jgi:hypothetical protein
MHSIAGLALERNAPDLGSVCSHLDLGLLGLSALAGTRCAFWPIPPFKPHLDTNDLQHNKILKLI